MAAIATGAAGKACVAGACGALVCLASTEAWAVDADVQSDSSAQFYDVRSPTGETILNRRRFTTTLAISAR